MAVKANKNYRVKNGDNWFNVAEKMRTRAQSLLKANPTVKKLVPGQVLRAPPLAPAAGASPQTLQQPSWAANYAARAPARNQTTVAQARVNVNARQSARNYTPPWNAPAVAPTQPARASAAPVATAPAATGGFAPTSQTPRYTGQNFVSVAENRGKPAAYPNARPTNARERAAAREKQTTLTTSYTNLENVRQALDRGMLPLVIRPWTIIQLKQQGYDIDASYLKQLGYTRDNDYGFWVRPMYEQQQPQQEMAVINGQQMAYGGGYGGGYGRYPGGGGGGGGGGGSYTETPTPNYGVYTPRAATGYATQRYGIEGQMPLISWRI
jgi:hypothetical protein